MYKKLVIWILWLLACFHLWGQVEPLPVEREDLGKAFEINGNIHPQDVIFSPLGYFFVPNSQSHHNISVYDRTYSKIGSIKDEVFLSDFMYGEYRGAFKGDPLGGIASKDGKYIWISNYQMIGSGFPILDMKIVFLQECMTQASSTK